MIAKIIVIFTLPVLGVYLAPNHGSKASHFMPLLHDEATIQPAYRRVTSHKPYVYGGKTTAKVRQIVTSHKPYGGKTRAKVRQIVTSHKSYGGKATAKGRQIPSGAKGKWGKDLMVTKSRALVRVKRVAPLLVFQVGMAVFNIALALGELIAQAVAYYKQEKESKYAQIMIELQNYSNWTIPGPTRVDYDIYSSKMSPYNYILRPKSYEAWTVKQTEDVEGIEGTASFPFLRNKFCFVYWKVAKESNFRKPNGLAIGCYPNDYDGNAYLDVAEAIAYRRRDSSKLVFSHFATYQSVLQYCEPDNMMCMQARMSPGHEAHAVVRIFPRNVANACSGVSKDDLDHILDTNTHCKLGSCDEIGAGCGTLKSSLGLVMFAIGWAIIA